MDSRPPVSSYHAPPRPPSFQYLAALAGVVLATVVRLPLEPLLQGQAPFALYYIPVLLSAWFLGVGPTALTTLLSILGAWYVFIPPAWSFEIAESGGDWSLLLFLVVSGTMVWLAREAGATRRAAAETDATRARLASLVESADAAIVSKDLNGIVRSWNEGAQRVFGYTADEMEGRSITVLFPPERVAEEQAILERIRRGERVEHYETVRLTKDGRRIDVSLTVSPVRDAAGRVVGASKIAQDVTGRKRAQRELAEQREWFRVTLSSIGDAVITTDQAGCVTFMNPVAEALTGRPVAEAKGIPLHEVFHIVNEHTRQPVENPCDKVLRTGLVVGLANHTVLISADGTERPVEDSAAPIIDGRGEVQGVVLVFRDGTERRRAEKERERAEVEREQLLLSERAARSEAERATRLKDEFMATLSHELRTPLNAILGWAQVLRRGQRDAATVARGLDVIERNTRLQAQLISDLLDISRIVSGKLQLDLSLVDLRTVVEAAIETVRSSADARGVELRLEVEEAPDLLLADSARLQQVVWNLLSNAVKFSAAGGTVTVTLRRAGEQAEIAVADQGIGILPEFMPYLFDRFRQGDGSTSRHFGGLGLGLAIVKRLTELHGGTVSASSEGKGRGATFVVRLPQAATRLDGAPVADLSGELTALPTPSSLSGLTILVVEDEADTRELVERLLAERGARIVAAASSEAALRALDAEQPDLIVSDIGLPGEDGYALMRRIRARGPGRGVIPAIALTAFARSEDRRRALQAGFQAHVTKPVEADELVATVASFAGLAATGRRIEE